MLNYTRPQDIIVTTLIDTNLSYPWAISVDPSNSDILYSASQGVSGTHIIAKISISKQSVNFILTGGYIWDGCQGLVADRFGNVYISDTNNHVIIRATTQDILSDSSNGTIIAGKYKSHGYKDGNSSVSLLNQPQGIVIDDISNYLYFCDNNNVIRRVDLLNSYNIVTFSSLISNPGSLAINQDYIWCAINNGPAIYRGLIDSFATSSVVQMILYAGSPSSAACLDGPLSSALFANIDSIFVDNSVGMLVADQYAIRFINFKNDNVSTIAGSLSYGFVNGNGSFAQFEYIDGIALNVYHSDKIYVTDAGNGAIRTISCTLGSYYSCIDGVTAVPTSMPNTNKGIIRNRDTIIISVVILGVAFIVGSIIAVLLFRKKYILKNKDAPQNLQVVL